MTIELPMSDYEEYINKKDAWIVWKLEDGKIANLKVYEADKDNIERFEKIYTRLKNFQPFQDIGNCLSHWTEMKLADVLYRLCFMYEFKDKETKKDAWKQLMIIKEFNEEMKWGKLDDD